MKKVINILKNKDLDIILLITIIITGKCLFVSLGANDELWNFANSYKMFIGFNIYKDLNVIITPLFFYVAQIFFYIFGATMLGFRTYNIFISSTLMILIYKLFKTLKIEKNRACTYTLVIIYIFYGMMAAGADYNIMAIIPIIINLIFIIKNKNKNNNFISGILLFLTFLLKQNVFIYYAIGLIIYEYINKQDIKSFIKNLIKKFLICGLFILMFLICLYINNNLYNFINYCFLGISEFGEKNIAYEMYGAIYICIGNNNNIYFFYI